jgi:hypothetical protein
VPFISTPDIGGAQAQASCGARTSGWTSPTARSFNGRFDFATESQRAGRVAPIPHARRASSG